MALNMLRIEILLRQNLINRPNYKKGNKKIDRKKKEQESAEAFQQTKNV